MLKDKIASVRKFKNQHGRKIVIATLVVTTAGTALMFRNQREFNAFLKEKNLLEEYYTPENSY